MTTLESLPGEILYHIATKCQPSTYYNFALAYKRLCLVSHNHYKKLYIRKCRTSTEEYEYLADGRRHGEYIRYLCGVVVERCTYRKDKIHGLHAYYTRSGKLMETTEYTMGWKIGKTIRYIPTNHWTEYDPKNTVEYKTMIKKTKKELQHRNWKAPRKYN